jgi:hypothetical protein
MATPKTTRQILDGNLTRVVPAGVFNRRVLVLGTSKDGPMYTPVSVSSADDAAERFGAFGVGTLTRGIKEAFDGQAGFSKTPDVWGMRVGGNKAARASGDILDIGGAKLLMIEAVNEGDMYNDISIKFKDGKIVLSNPKTGLSSSYTIDFSDWSNPDAQIHTLDELAANINADSNLSAAMSAVVYDYKVNFEVDLIADNAAIVSAAAGETKIDISALTGASAEITNGDLYLTGLEDGNTAWDTPNNQADLAQEKNAIREMYAAYSINASGVTECLAGDTAVKVEGSIAKGVNYGASAGAVHPILQGVLDNTGWKLNAATSEAYYRVRGAQAVFYDTAGSALGSDIPNTSGDDIVTLRVNCAAASMAADTADALAGADRTVYNSEGTELPAGATVANDKHIKITILNTNSGVQSHAVFGGTGVSGNDESGVTLDGEVLVTFTAATGDSSAYVEIKTHQGDLPALAGDGDNLGPFEAYVSFDTELIGLTPYSTMASLTGAQDYFVRGNEVVFGAAQAHTLAFIFAKVSYYDYGTTLLLTDGQAGKMTLSGSCQGGYDCGVLADAPATFGFSYSYYPGNPTTSTVTLAGGADGINLTNANLYDDLDEAYTHLNQDFFDIFTIIGARWDSSKETYDAVTGVPITSNAGFADQMRIFLDSFNGELIGVMGFEPLIGTGVGGRILASDVRNRVDYMTTPNMVGDPLRAANALNGFHQPFMYAPDAEVIMNYRGNLYGTDAAAVTCGLLAAIPTEEAIYRFNLPGAQGLVWRYDAVDVASGKEQIDLLSDARLPVGVVNGNNIKLSESRSMGRAGSDFENIMTVLILQEVLEICRNTARDYIGKVTSQALLQAFQSQLDRTIGDRMVPRALRGFKAPITMTPGERVVGKLTIPLTLSPQFELRDVHYVVQLTADEVVAVTE